MFHSVTCAKEHFKESSQYIFFIIGGRNSSIRLHEITLYTDHGMVDCVVVKDGILMELAVEYIYIEVESENSRLGEDEEHICGRQFQKLKVFIA